MGGNGGVDELERPRAADVGSDSRAVRFSQDVQMEWN
jgi:hypothetical protein